MSSPRSTFDQRKEDLLEAALTAFSQDGYHKVTTAQVAEVAGISQPYVFRFFPSKDDLFLAVVDRVYGRISREFHGVEDGPGVETRLVARYEELMRSFPREIVFQVQTWGIRDPRVSSLVATAVGLLLEEIEAVFRRNGIDHPRDRAETFIARGLLCNLSLALGAPELYRSAGS